MSRLVSSIGIAFSRMSSFPGLTFSCPHTCWKRTLWLQSYKPFQTLHHLSCNKRRHSLPCKVSNRKTETGGVWSLVSKKGRKMRQQLYQEQLKKQNAAAQLPEDGTPVFTLFTKSPSSPLWFPIASFQGDGRSKMLVNACKTIWGRRLYMGTLNRGVARSVFGKDFGRLIQRIVRQLPDLRQYQSELQFAYDVTQKGADTNHLSKIQLTPEMGMTGIEWLRYRLTRQVPKDMQVAMKIVKMEKEYADT